MRPNGLESLRTIQTALAEYLAPELSSVYALDIVQTLNMLVESLANEWDTAAEDLRSENETLRKLLGSAGVAGNVLDATTVSESGEALRLPVPGTVTLSGLSAENQKLRAALEGLLVGLETSQSRLSDGAQTLRGEIYAHLREVSLRGWSFWDMASFREKMAAIRAMQAR